MNEFLKKIFEKIRDFQAPFKVNKKCTRCGICVKMCPTQTIKMTDNKVIFMFDKCVGCKACARTCPNKAIGIK